MMHCQWHTDTSINGMNVDRLFINDVSVSGGVSWPSNASLFIEIDFYFFLVQFFGKKTSNLCPLLLTRIRYNPR